MAICMLTNKEIFINTAEYSLMVDDHIIVQVVTLIQEGGRLPKPSEETPPDLFSLMIDVSDADRVPLPICFIEDLLLYSVHCFNHAQFFK